MIAVVHTGGCDPHHDSCGPNWQAIAKRGETFTVDNRTMRVIQVRASPSPLPPQAKLFPFPLGARTKGYHH